MKKINIYFQINNQMSNESNEEISFDFDENAPIEDDEVDSVLSGESGRRERSRNLQDINLYKLLSRKRKCTQFCFKKIIFLSFIPTLIYNVFWIVKIKHLILKNLTNCDFTEFTNVILTICYIVLAKGFLILFFPQIRCGNEKNNLNDFSYICVLLKTLTTYLCSLFLTNNISKKFDLNDSINSYEEIFYWINMYYKLECIYIKGIHTIIGIILTAVLMVVIKELFKTIRYVL